MPNKLLAALVFSGSLLLGACSSPNMVAVPYSPETLYNIDRARTFTAEGRYELAREHYLLALAGNRNPDMRDQLAEELHSVDLMIKTMR